MKSEEEKLREQRETALAAVARKALDKGKVEEALSVIGKISGYRAENLITLLGIIGFNCEQGSWMARASRLFDHQLRQCSQPQTLVQVAQWIRNPVRSRSIPPQFKDAVDNRRKKLEPRWDGHWENPGVAPSNKALEISKKRPEEVFDPKECLIAAGQCGNSWGHWIHRYETLGGNTEDPIYLKMVVSKAVNHNVESTARIKGLLRKFVSKGKAATVRSFLRNITPTHGAAEGTDPSLEMARYALPLYCQWNYWTHTMEDWMHIAESALYLDQFVITRLLQHILLCEGGMSEQGEEILQRLNRRNGVVDILCSVREDKDLFLDPVWEIVYSSVHTNADAKKILAAYCKQKIDSK